jgi:hypothetical protein
MSKKVDDAIFGLVNGSKDRRILIRKGDIAKRAKLTNCKIVDVNASLRRLTQREKLTCTLIRESGMLELQAESDRA